MTLESKGLRLIAAHNNNVQNNMADVIGNLAKRMADHDQSKYSENEFDLVEGKSYLQTLEYNTPEYKVGLARIQTAVEHHYQSNSHHPEHFKTWECNGCFKAFDENSLPDNMHCDVCMCEIFQQNKGIRGMTLLDLIEMACDWQAASIEHNSTFLTSINRNVERFGLSIEVQEILMNTGREMGWIE